MATVQTDVRKWVQWDEINQISQDELLSHFKSIIIYKYTSFIYIYTCFFDMSLEFKQV